MNNALVVLVMDMLYFNLMLKNMPAQTNSDLIIVTDTRVKDITDDIKECLKMHGLKARVIPAEPIIRYTLKSLNLTDEGKDFVCGYTMGLNILTQYYLLSHPLSQYYKILFLDDDVLINKDLGRLFDKYKYAFAKSILGYQFRSSDYDKQLLEYYGASQRIWKMNHINGGQRMYHRDILPVYKWMLELFFNNWEFHNAWHLWRAGFPGWKTKAFFIDQNFENCVAFNAKVMNASLNPHVRVLNSMKLPKNLSILLDRELLHYAVGPRENKIALLKALKKEGLIK